MPPLSRRRVQTQARAETCSIDLLINLSLEIRYSNSYNFNELTILLARQAFGLPGDLEHGVVHRSHVVEMLSEARQLRPDLPRRCRFHCSISVLPAPLIREVPAGTTTQTSFDRAFAFNAVSGVGLGAASIGAKGGARITQASAAGHPRHPDRDRNAGHDRSSNCIQCSAWCGPWCGGCRCKEWAHAFRFQQS